MHILVNSLRRLLAVSILGAIAVHAGSESLGPCTLQAWVRAPDLVPGTIVQGDARLKLAVGCTTVESAVLGLRFKERSFAKASRSIEATRRPARPDIAIDPFDPEHISPASPWALPSYDAINCSAGITYAEIVKERSLWSIREEERIVFESTQQIGLGQKQSEAIQDVVQNFAILVPLTNFPPAWDYSRSLPDQRNEEFVNVETIYEYFVRVVFANRSIAEIPAGFTAFQPLYDPPKEDQLTFRTVQLQTTELLEPVATEGDPIANYTVDVFNNPDAFAFLQGSEQSILALVKRRGRARRFDEPLTLNICLDANIASKWASEHTSDPTLQPVHKPNQLLRATSANFKSSSTKETKTTSRCGSPFTVQGSVIPPKSFWMPNATDAQIEAGEIVSTTAHAFSLPVRVDPRQSTDFETYYHTLVSTLRLSLMVPRAEDEPDHDSHDITRVRKWRDRLRGSAGVEMEPDEDAWVPWQRVPEVKPWPGVRAYTGEAPVRVYPPRDAWVSPHCVRVASGGDAAGILDMQPPEQIQVGMELAREKNDAEEKDADAPGVETEAGCVALFSLVHYLSDGARAPVFVDADDASLRTLRAQTAAERDALARHLSPVVVFPPDGEERVHRYYRTPKDARPPIYVGETWVKKVAHVDEHKVTEQRPDPMRDAIAKWQTALKHVFDEL